MKFWMLMVSLWSTQLKAQWSGAESLQKRAPGVLGGYYYAACIPHLKNPGALFYGEKISHTNISALKFLVHAKIANQNLLVAFEQEHTNYLQHSFFSIGFGKIISQQVSMGIKVGYDMIHAQGYGSKGNLNSGFGLFLKASDKIAWAIQLNHLESLAAGSILKNFEGKVGMGYIVSDLCGISVALLIMEHRNANVEMGIYYQILDKARFRIEFDSNIPCLRSSIGYQFSFAEAEFFSQYQMSGISSFGIGLFCQIKKKPI